MDIQHAGYQPEDISGGMINIIINKEGIAKPPGSRASCPRIPEKCGLKTRIPGEAGGFAISSAAILFLLISAICVFIANARAADISLSGILRAVQNNVDFLKEHIVDLISEEEITVEEFNDKGKVKNKINITAEYRVFPELKESTPDCRVIYDIVESFLPAGILREERILLSVKENNKTRLPDGYEFKEHFGVGGSSYVELLFLFDKNNEKCFDYELKGAGKYNDRDVYIIGIKRKEADSGRRRIENENISWDMKYDVTALIDAGTMEIVQLNRERVEISFSSRRTAKTTIAGMFPYVTTRYYLFIQYEYERVKIRDRYLTLPVAKTARLLRINEQPEAVYKYRYGNHRMFAVGTKVLFDAVPE